MNYQGAQFYATMGPAMTTPSAESTATARYLLAKEFWNFWPAFARWTESQAQGSSLTPQRMRIIDQLHAHGPQKMSELKEALGVTATNITALVDALEKEGWVVRQPHPSDRRATLIALSPQTTGEFCRGCTDFMGRVSGLFDSLTESEQAELLRMMALLKQRMGESGR